MDKENIIKLLRERKEKQGKYDLKKLEIRKKELELEKLKENKAPSTTSSYTDGGKGNEVGSKVENFVINKDEKVKKLKIEIEELKKEIEILEIDLEELKIRLESLTYLEKEIITDYYINGLSLEDIGNITYYRITHQTRNSKTIKRKIERIIEKMQNL